MRGRNRIGREPVASMLVSNIPTDRVDADAVTDQVEGTARVSPATPCFAAT